MKPFPRWCIWIGSVLSGLTGLVYWWMVHMMEPISEWAVINHPLQPWVLKAHIVTSPLLLFAIGLITMDHVWKQYRLRLQQGRHSGVTAMVVFGPMALSGYLIQAVTAPVWLAALAWIHLLTGIAFLAGLAVHQVVIPKRRTRRSAREVDLEVVRSDRGASARSRARAGLREADPAQRPRRGAGRVGPV